MIDDDLPGNKERHDLYEAELDELEADLPAFERAMQRIERRNTTEEACEDGPHG